MAKRRSYRVKRRSRCNFDQVNNLVSKEICQKLHCTFRIFALLIKTVSYLFSCFCHRPLCSSNSLVALLWSSSRCAPVFLQKGPIWWKTLDEKAPLQIPIENIILGENNSVQTLEIIVKFTYDLASLSVFQSKWNRHLEAWLYPRTIMPFLPYLASSLPLWIENLAVDYLEYQSWSHWLWHMVSL